MSSLDGKVALVTGASRGIGRALAVGLAQHGAEVAVNYRADGVRAEETCELVRQAGQRTVSIQADVGRRGAAGQLIKNTISSLGRLDILVNNASIKLMKPADEITDELFDQVIDTNLRGTFFASVCAARAMCAAGGGSIINITSCAAELMVAAHSIYSVSKGAVEQVTRQLAFEFAPRVRVNAIAPGATDVDSSRDWDPALREKWGSVTPLGRIAQPADYIGPVVFLSSEQSSFLTGEVLHVDGGWTLAGNAPPLPTAQAQSASVSVAAG